MIQSALVTPPNSLLLVISSADPQIPANIENLVEATSTCIAIGTRPEMDGPTQLTLTDEDVPMPGLQELYRGTLDTGLHRVAVQTVEGDQVAEVPVPGSSAQVAVYGSGTGRIVVRLS